MNEVRLVRFVNALAEYVQQLNGEGWSWAEWRMMVVNVDDEFDDRSLELANMEMERRFPGQVLIERGADPGTMDVMIAEPKASL